MVTRQPIPTLAISLRDLTIFRALGVRNLTQFDRAHAREEGRGVKKDTTYKKGKEAKRQWSPWKPTGLPK